MKIDWSKYSWQHGVMTAAGVAAAAATGVMAKAVDICMSVPDGAVCVSNINNICGPIVAIAGVVVFVFGHTSTSIVAKNPSNDAN